MKIFFFLVHPAHFHLFKNVINILEKRKHNITILIKTKDVLEHLLKSNGFNYLNALPREKRGSTRISVAISSIDGLIKRQYKLAKIAYEERPDIMVGTEWSLAHVGRLLNIPSMIVNEDDTDATPENYLIYPFATNLILPACTDVGKWQKRRISYHGYHELAYLHPKYFIPDRKVIETFNPSFDRYFLIRFVKLSASHDIGKSGITNEIAKKLIFSLSKKGNVYISSEKTLSSELEPYRIRIDPCDIHHAIYYSDLIIGDSQTMIAEAAVLGTPSVRFNDFVGKLGYLEEMEYKYGLTYGIPTSEPENLYRIVEKLVAWKDIRHEWSQRRDKMLSEKIDVTEFFVWLIEKYPDSVKEMQRNPATLNKFCFKESV